MRRPLALALVALVFVVGAVVGVVATHLYYLHRLGHPGGIADFALDVGARRLTSELDLRADQRQELDRILGDARDEITALRHDVVLRLRDIRDCAADRFASELDADQRRELERLRVEQGKMFDRYLQ